MSDLLMEAGKTAIHFFVQKGAEVVMDRLVEFATRIQSDSSATVMSDPRRDFDKIYPSVCLLGLGRCGSNIAVGVSALVYKAQESQRARVDVVAGENQEEAGASPIVPNAEEKGSRQPWWDRYILRRGGADNTPSLPRGNLFLAEPVVFVGDLNKDIKDHFGASSYSNIIDDYRRLIVLNFETYQKTGAGNHPMLGQYLANMLLAKDPQHAHSESWQLYHNYLIDSVGLPANPTRLYFYIFSAGGGTGAGMASEFGSAQSIAFRTRAVDRKRPNGPAGQAPPPPQKSADQRLLGLDFVFSSGMAILPYGTNFTPDREQAFKTRDRSNQSNQTNAGRVLTRYYAQLWNNRDDIEGDAGNSRPPRSFDCLILISNDIMRFAISGSSSDNPIDMVQAEEYANNYVSQQIFNILTAQAPTTDYDPAYIKSSGIDIGETIKLDPMDLRNSMAGPVVVGYAEAAVGNLPHQPARVDARDLLRRAIALPSFNQTTRAIEGISVLPVDVISYRELFDQKTGAGKFSFAALGRVLLFGRCPAVVVVVSLPVDFKLQFSELEELKTSISELFPQAEVIRYSVIIGASRNLSLTILISKSACVADEARELVIQFIKMSLGKEDFRDTPEIENLINDYIKVPRRKRIAEEHENNVQFRGQLQALLEAHEAPQRNTQASWSETRSVFERKFFDLVPEIDPPLPLDALRVGFDEVVDALCYMRFARIHKKPDVLRTSIGLEPEV